MEIYGLEISKTSELAPTESFDIIFWFQGFPSILKMSSKLSSLAQKIHMYNSHTSSEFQLWIYSVVLCKLLASFEEVLYYRAEKKLY